MTKTSKVPLYRQIAGVLREEIRTQYSLTDQLPTRRKLAERFNVSYLTIHQAMKELATESVIDSAGRLGTFVTDTQNHLRGLIGILVSSKDPLYMSQLFGAMERKLREVRFRPVLHGGNVDYEEELQALKEIGQFKEAGLILYSQYAEQLAPQIANLVQSGIPVTTINWPYGNADCARVDQFMIGVLQARYVLEKKCRQLLYIDLKVKRFRGMAPQMDGFLTTIQESGLGIPVRMESFYTEKTCREADKEINTQLAGIVRRHFADPSQSLPDAIITYDRYLSIVVETLRSLGREPGRDVILVGDDDHNLSGFPYATIDERHEEIGEHAVRLLLERIDKKYQGPPQIFDICPKLVEHFSE